MKKPETPFWSLNTNEILNILGTSVNGLSQEDAGKRLKIEGPNTIKPPVRTDRIFLLISQFKSPIILILVFAAMLSGFLDDPTDAVIIIIIVLISGILGYWQEKSAADAVKKLLLKVRVTVDVLRDGNFMEISIEDIVPGDIIGLNAGDIIPGDCRILESRDLHVNEAMLTGETYPIEKAPCELPSDTILNSRSNCLFMGTSVVNGTARAVVIYTGRYTVFGQISEELKLRPPETSFQHGIKRFGYLLMEVTLILIIAIFAVNVYFERSVIESFLFSLAIAVGLTPQLLPAIITINVAKGARIMSKNDVIVKKLSSIENFGSMDVLCSDKTGTLTKGVMEINSVTDIAGNKSDKVLLYIYLNSYFETGFSNPIDEAIKSFQPSPDISHYSKLDEIPYDFVRKRLSILVNNEGENLMITKGAFFEVLSICSSAVSHGGVSLALHEVRDSIESRFRKLSAGGFRILGVAYKDMGSRTIISKDDERDLNFAGFISFYDPPKEGVFETINELNTLGIELKILTGDRREVALYISNKIGMSEYNIITGGELRKISNEAMIELVNRYNIFAEVEPVQKERIILALKKAGKVVGFMGDGINDASALHSADVSISVDSAADVAKQAADIILLRMDLDVLSNGIKLGRETFANTLKYMFMATSANFGNMFSMAGASLFLQFLPLLPKQILLTNLLTDLPEMTIANDNVDRDLVEKPKKLDLNFIRNFMVTFGLVSSFFDYLTFAVLILIFNTNVDEFRTGWFLESVISATLIILVIRTRKPFFKSPPGRYLAFSIFFIILATIILPYTPLAHIFSFRSVPLNILGSLALIICFYLVTTEVVKYYFYKRIKS